MCIRDRWKLVAGALFALAGSILLLVYAGSFLRSDDQQATTGPEKQSVQQNQKNENKSSSQGQAKNDDANRKTDPVNLQDRPVGGPTTKSPQPNKLPEQVNLAPKTNAKAFSNDLQLKGGNSNELKGWSPSEKAPANPMGSYFGEQPSPSSQLPDVGTDMLTNQENPAKNQEPDVNTEFRSPLPGAPQHLSLIHI